MTNKERGQLANNVGQLGEAIFQRLCPSAVQATHAQAGYDFLTISGQFVEVKTSRFNTEKQGWRFELSYQQCLCADWVSFILLDQFGGVFKHFLIPFDEIPGKKNEIGEYNLALFEKWEVK